MLRTERFRSGLSVFASLQRCLIAEVMGLCSRVAAVVLLGRQLPFQPSTMKLVALLNDVSWHLQSGHCSSALPLSTILQLQRHPGAVPWMPEQHCSSLALRTSTPIPGTLWKQERRWVTHSLRVKPSKHSKKRSCYNWSVSREVVHVHVPHHFVFLESRRNDEIHSS